VSAWVIEGGLVDAHAHLSFEPHDVFKLPRGSRELIAAGLRAHRAAGELVVRDAGALPGVEVAGDDEVTVIACGPFLAPPGHYMPHLYEGVAPAEAPERAASIIQAGNRWAKVILDFPGPGDSPLNPRLGYEPAVLREIAAAVHEAGGRLAMHVMGDRVDLAIEAGADSIEHGNFASPDAVREMARRRIAWVPTLATVAERHLEPIAEQVAPAKALLARQRETLPLAAELGVTVLAGTDEEPHGSVAREVLALIRYGLPVSDAIAAASSAAHAFFETAHTGAVAFDRDPHEDPGVLAHPRPLP
jgi:imidazolonepropionase-like amidohydrolase